MIFASDDEDKKVFPDVPLIGFKITRNLKAHLVRSKLPDLDEVGWSKPYRGKRPPCHLCENMKDTCTFKSKHLNEVHKINKKYNCNSKMAFYLDLGQIIIRASRESFLKKEAVLKQALKQKRFHKHYCSDRYNGIQDSVIILIDSANTLKELRKKELHWMYKLKTFAPYGLNERDVYETL